MASAKLAVSFHSTLPPRPVYRRKMKRLERIPRRCQLKTHRAPAIRKWVAIVFGYLCSTARLNPAQTECRIPTWWDGSLFCSASKIIAYRSFRWDVFFRIWFFFLIVHKLLAQHERPKRVAGWARIYHFDEEEGEIQIAVVVQSIL